MAKRTESPVRGARVNADPALLPLRGILDSLDEPVAVVDGRGRHVYSNGAFHSLVGVRPAELRGRRFPFPYWSSESIEALQAHLEAELAGKLRKPRHPPVSASFRTARGERIPVSLTCDTVRDSKGRVRYHVTLIRRDGVLRAGRSRGRDDLRARVRHLEHVVRRVVLDLSDAGVTPGLLPVNGPLPGNGLLHGLSPRETEVLEEFLVGQRVPTVAARLEISENTVRAHLKSIFKKAGVQSQAELLDRLRPRG
jgi:PAS domain S-box-containing protein